MTSPKKLTPKVVVFCSSETELRITQNSELLLFLSQLEKVQSTENMDMLGSAWKTVAGRCLEGHSVLILMQPFAPQNI